jgi:predicted nucleic acid-binding protein
MVKALFDTNILIDYLNAVPQAREELARYEARSISFISWMEVLVGAPQEVEQATRAFLSRFTLAGLDDRIAERAVDLRRRHRIRLPDAIIWATADVGGMLLVTRNTRDFDASNPGIRIPYTL